VEGRRITDQETIDVVTMVYGGLVNKKIVGMLQARNANALGLTGADAALVRAHKRLVKEIDYGFVGDIESVNADFLETILSKNVLPVVAPLSMDTAGQLLNTNADTMAQSLAVAMNSLYQVQLVYCFEKTGVLLDLDNPESLVKEITPNIYTQLKQQQVIHSGMIPKLDNAFQALTEGVEKVIICHANNLLTLQTPQPLATVISN
jgi:acetylglutamate kinase